jgi:hypothetical protein
MSEDESALAWLGCLPPDYPLLVTPRLWSIYERPVAEGLVRLYRGEHPTSYLKVDCGSAVRGGWFSSNLGFARYFRRRHDIGGYIVFIDVSPNVLKNRAIEEFSSVFNDKQIEAGKVFSFEAGQVYLFPEIRQRIWPDYSSYFDSAVAERKRAREALSPIEVAGIERRKQDQAEKLAVFRQAVSDYKRSEVQRESVR